MIALLLALAPVADMTGGRKCHYGKGDELIYDAADWGHHPPQKIRVIWCRIKPVFEGGAWRTGGTPNPRAPYWLTHRPEDGK